MATVIKSNGKATVCTGGGQTTYVKVCSLKVNGKLRRARRKSQETKDLENSLKGLGLLVMVILFCLADNLM